MTDHRVINAPFWHPLWAFLPFLDLFLPLPFLFLFFSSMLLIRYGSKHLIKKVSWHQLQMKVELNENVGPFSWGKRMLASGLDAGGLVGPGSGLNLCH